MCKDFHTHLLTLPGKPRKFSRGKLIFERDDPVDSLFCVDSGEVHLLRRQEDGAEYILQRATAGTLLAEASLTTTRYHCAAVAIKESRVTVYRRVQVLDLIRRNSDAALALVLHLGREVRNARLRAEIGSLRKVADRLDAWLAWNDHRMPQKGRWGQVAAELGVSPEALYRELAKRRRP